jgi:hypothetical protein
LGVTNVLSFPKWLLNQHCKCGHKINGEDLYEVGVFTYPAAEGRFFMRFSCPHCRFQGTLEFGDEKWNLEKLCKFFLDDLRAQKEKGEKTPDQTEEIQKFKKWVQNVNTIDDLIEGIAGNDGNGNESEEKKD